MTEIAKSKPENGVVHLLFTTKEIGKVRGFGLNDWGDENYTLHQLSYVDASGSQHISREQMQRTHDCDSDDTIVLVDHTDKTPEEIKLIPIEILWHEDEFCDEYSHENCPPYQ